MIHILYASFKKNLLWSQGRQILYVLAGLTCISFFLLPVLLYLLLAFFIFSFIFFRYPDRVCNQALGNSNIIVCPADGKVVAIQHDSDNGFEGYAHKVSIFLSPLDVHVNWVPFTGKVKNMIYKKGNFQFAFLPKSSDFNESNSFVFSNALGRQLVVRQIAGTVARRICWWVNVGESVKVGDTFGMIRFGSRVDILLPENVIIEVMLGQRVYGGKTVLAIWQ